MKRIQYVESGNNKDGPDKRLDEYIQSRGGLLNITNRDMVQEGMEISRHGS